MITHLPQDEVWEIIRSRLRNPPEQIVDEITPHGWGKEFCDLISGAHRDTVLPLEVGTDVNAKRSKPYK